MRRVASPVRRDLASQIAQAGFNFSEVYGRPYWDESARYEFSLDEIEDRIEAPTNALYALCLELVARAVASESVMDRLGLPAPLREAARDSWRRGEPSLYGRFDLSLPREGPAKLLEFNADTPTCLYESAVFQWTWLEQGRERGVLPASSDQFTSLHDALVGRWPDVARGQLVHFCSLDNEEDEGTTSYLRETAKLARVAVGDQLHMREIGLGGGRFVDLGDAPIDCLFKLYPWEWLVRDAFGQSPAMAHTRFVEPAWKAILSTKAILPLLWEMAPNHPNLLPAVFEGEGDIGPSYVRKRCYAREGANIDMVDAGALVEQTGGVYDGRAVLQTLAPLPSFEGRHPVIGSWIVGERACGIGIRESAERITTNAANFVPHVIV